MMHSKRSYQLSLIIASSLLLAGCWPFGSGIGNTKNSKPALVMINVLEQVDYDDCHIKGSIHIDFDDFEAKIKSLDKDNHYVVYCADYMCMSSSFCAKLLQQAGFKHVWAYEGGMAEWYQKGYPYEGPAEIDYLRNENVNLAEDEVSEVPTITAEELLAKIEAFRSENK